MGSVADQVMPDDAFRPDRLADANINPQTRLATDYLNHFNDVVMMLELVPDMPDCAEDVRGWEPVAYDDYFRASHFREKDLAVAAYHAADPAIRSTFDATITHLDCAMAEALDLVEHGDPAAPEVADRLRRLVGDRLKPLIAAASGIINGASVVAFPSGSGAEADAQAAVDELFP